MKNGVMHPVAAVTGAEEFDEARVKKALPLFAPLDGERQDLAAHEVVWIARQTGGTPLFRYMSTNFRSTTERSRHWRLILGGALEDKSDGRDDGLCGLAGADLAMVRALQALYESNRSGGFGSSCPTVARWLGNLRQYLTWPFATCRTGAHR